jgi:hypothetical protein
MSPDPEDLLLDRRGIAELSREELGPGAFIPKSKIEKLAMAGEGPPVDARLGLKYLTKKRNARLWLRSVLRSAAAA